MDQSKTQREQSVSNTERRTGDREAREEKEQGKRDDVMVAENLTAYYGSFKALDNISMNVERNKITALIGPSGCGKSTFLRCLNRMHEVIRGARMEGELLLDGRGHASQGRGPGTSHAPTGRHGSSRNQTLSLR